MVCQQRERNAFIDLIQGYRTLSNSCAMNDYLHGHFTLSLMYLGRLWTLLAVIYHLKDCIWWFVTLKNTDKKWTRTGINSQIISYTGTYQRLLNIVSICIVPIELLQTHIGCSKGFACICQKLLHKRLSYCCYWVQFIIGGFEQRGFRAWQVVVRSFSAG